MNGLLTVSLLAVLVFCGVSYFSIWVTINSSFRKAHHTNVKPLNQHSDVKGDSSSDSDPNKQMFTARISHYTDSGQPGRCKQIESVNDCSYSAGPSQVCGQEVNTVNCNSISLPISDDDGQIVGGNKFRNVCRVQQMMRERHSNAAGTFIITNGQDTVSNITATDSSGDSIDDQTIPQNSIPIGREESKNKSGQYVSLWRKIVKKMTEEHPTYLEFDSQTDDQESSAAFGIIVLDINAMNLDNEVEGNWSRGKRRNSIESEHRQSNFEENLHNDARNILGKTCKDKERIGNNIMKKAQQEKFKRLQRTAKMMSVFVGMFALQWMPYITYSLWDMVATPHVTIIFSTVIFTNLGGLFNYYAYTYLRGRYLGYRSRTNSPQHPRTYTISASAECK